MSTDAMEVIDASITKVKVGDETLELRPMKVGAFPKIIRLARPVIDAVLDLDSLPDEDTDAMVDLAMNMVDKHGEALFEAVGIAIGKDKAWVEDADMGDFIELCIALVKVNKDFFTRRLAPLLAERAKGKAAALQQGTGAGRTPSSSSSNAATG